MSKDKKPKKDKEPPAEVPVFTLVNCGQPGRGVSFRGFMPRPLAVQRALRHYRAEAERVQQAIENLELNAVRIGYSRHGEPILPVEAARVQRKQDRQAERVKAATPGV